MISMAFKKQEITFFFTLLHLAEICTTIKKNEN